MAVRSLAGASTAGFCSTTAARAAAALRAAGARTAPPPRGIAIFRRILSSSYSNSEAPPASSVRSRDSSCVRVSCIEVSLGRELLGELRSEHAQQESTLAEVALGF